MGTEKVAVSDCHCFRSLVLLSVPAARTRLI